MSVSAHLTPEPERRLWLILENVRREVESVERKAGALTAFAAAELAFLKPAAGAGPLDAATTAALALVLPLGVLVVLPLTRFPKWLAVLEPHKGKQNVADCLILSEDIAKYPLGDLILRLDKYLGGGITATLYYEDIVAQILANAAATTRKKRLLRALYAIAGAAQMGLAVLALKR